MKTNWKLECNGKSANVTTTDKDGHTAHKAWEKGVVFFKGAPDFSRFRITRQAPGETVTALVENLNEKVQLAWNALRTPEEEMSDG